MCETNAENLAHTHESMIGCLKRVIEVFNEDTVDVVVFVNLQYFSFDIWLVFVAPRNVGRISTRKTHYPPSCQTTPTYAPSPRRRLNLCVNERLNTVTGYVVQ